MIDCKRIFILLVAICCLLGSTAVLAQDEGEIVFGEDEVDVIEGSPENAERIANFLRIADNSIMDYVNETVDSIQQGHRQGFSDFRTWYRQRRADQAADEATERMLAELFGSALKLGLDYIFPGSGTFITILKSGCEAAYNLAVDQIGSVSEGDTNMFLDQHERSLQAVITSFEDVGANFRQNAGEDMAAVKWEFVFEAMDREAEGGEETTEVGPRTRQLLRRMGIPGPGANTSTAYRVRVLTRQIYGIFSQDSNLRVSWGDRDMRAAAAGAANREVYPGQPDRYCPHETDLNNFFWTDECREWHRRVYSRD